VPPEGGAFEGGDEYGVEGEKGDFYFLVGGEFYAEFHACI
jgi:hypothetical protein